MADEPRCEHCDSPTCDLPAALTEAHRLDRLAGEALEANRKMIAPDDFAAWRAAKFRVMAARGVCTPFDWRAEAQRLRASVTELRWMVIEAVDLGFSRYEDGKRMAALRRLANEGGRPLLGNTMWWFTWQCLACPQSVMITLRSDLEDPVPDAPRCPYGCPPENMAYDGQHASDRDGYDPRMRTARHI